MTPPIDEDDVNDDALRGLRELAAAHGHYEVAKAFWYLQSTDTAWVKAALRYMEELLEKMDLDPTMFGAYDEDDDDDDDGFDNPFRVK